MLMRNLWLNPEVKAIWGRGNEAQLLAAYEQVWERKRILREFYQGWYRQIAAQLRLGAVVEIGAGTGNFKRWLQPRSCWTLDILPGKYVNVQANALDLPFRRESLDNIVMIDALHHLARPWAFLQKAAEVLRPAGRLIMFEPFVSVWGWWVYKFFHHETVDFRFEDSMMEKGAWEGNAAIPKVVLAAKNRSRLPLRPVRIEYSECLAYPLSGGFSYRPLLPVAVLLGLQKLERLWLFRNRFLSLRVLATLEKPA